MLFLYFCTFLLTSCILFKDDHEIHFILLQTINYLKALQYFIHPLCADS